jgi:hypothetical protein
MSNNYEQTDESKYANELIELLIKKYGVAIPRWISVEQPPDVKNKGHVWCHVCLKDGHVTYGQYSQAFGFRVLVTMEIAGEYRLAETDEVARWTPLPAPPVV